MTSDQQSRGKCYSCNRESNSNSNLALTELLQNASHYVECSEFCFIFYLILKRTLSGRYNASYANMKPLTLRESK